MIAISALANASNVTADGNADSEASATAEIEYGISPGCLCWRRPAASAKLTNDGSIAILASAHAYGAVTGESYSCNVYASAEVDSGIHQGATANYGAATIGLVNNGTIDISAVAKATAETGDARQRSLLSTHGISQVAFAWGTDDDATVTLNNTGALTISACGAGAWAAVAYAYATIRAHLPMPASSCWHRPICLCL